MDGDALGAVPDLDRAFSGGDVDGAASPGPRHAVPGALPGDEAVAADQALVSEEGLHSLTTRHRQQVRLLAREAIDRPLAGRAVTAQVRDALGPGVGLAIELREVREDDRRPEVVADVLDAALDAALGLRAIWPTQPRIEADPQREVEEDRVPVRHPASVAAEHDDLRIVVEAVPRDAAEGLEGVQVAAQEGPDVRPADELYVEQPRPGEHHHEAPEPLSLPRRRDEREVAKVDLRLLPRLRLEPHRDLHGPPQAPGPHVVLENRVAAGVTLRPQLAEQHDAVLDARRHATAHVVTERVELRRRRRARLYRRQARRPQVLPDSVSGDGQDPRDLPNRALLPVQLPELLHGSPSQHSAPPRARCPRVAGRRGGGSIFDRR